VYNFTEKILGFSAVLILVALLLIPFGLLAWMPVEWREALSGVLITLIVLSWISEHLRGLDKNNKLLEEILKELKKRPPSS
jgi:uncharacterized membrane protein